MVFIYHLFLICAPSRAFAPYTIHTHALTCQRDTINEIEATTKKCTQVENEVDWHFLKLHTQQFDEVFSLGVCVFLVSTKNFHVFLSNWRRLLHLISDTQTFWNFFTLRIGRIKPMFFLM